MLPASLQRSRIYSTVVAAVTAMSVTGCAVLNPVQQPADARAPASVLARLQATSEKGECRFAGCIDDAIAYGEAWRAHYYSQVQEVELWRNSLLGTILPITAFALYRGAYTDNSKKQIGALAATAGTLFGSTQFFGLPDAQKIHLAGADTLTCTLLQARKLIVTHGDVDTLAGNLAALRDALDHAQSTYSMYRVANANGLPADQSKALQAAVLKPIEKRLAFYEGVYRRGRAVEIDARTSGEAVRRQVDLITSATAAQIVEKTPKPEALLALVGNFRSYADKIGQGAFPAPTTTTSTTADDKAPAPSTPTPSPSDPATPEKAAVVHQELKRLPETHSGLAAIGDKQATTSALASVTQNFTIGQLARNAPEVKQAYAAALRPIIASNATGLKAVESKALADSLSAEVTKRTQEAARAVLTPKPAPPAPTGIFEQMLQSMGDAKTIEFHLKGQDGGLDVKGTYTREPNEAERAAAARAAKEAKDANSDLAKFVRKNVAAAADSYTMLKAAAAAAEVVYHQIVGWGVAADGIPAACTGGGGTAHVFKITPELTDVSLVVGKPMTFIVSNDKQIPKVTLAGKNTDKVKFEMAVNGDDFIVTVTASGAIEDGEEAILVVTDASGKRKFEVKLEAIAK